MALPRLRAIDDPADAIPDPLDDPAYAAATELLTKFNERWHRLDQERLRLHYEIYFSNRTAADNNTDKMLREKLAGLRALPPLQPTPTAAPSASSKAIADAIAVLEGQKVEPSAPQAVEVERQLAALRPGINEQTEVCEAILAELTVKYAKQLLPARNERVLAMFRAAQELSRARQRFREFRAAIVQKNIRTGLLRNVNVASPLQLGSEADWNSEISHWRRTLEEWHLL
jgi:hypothetical protein